mmetsp:Transcript_104568/g.320315  ORF Transcript_104568/g.320315 Transcript_104568/m.320315 type:complete len:233 (-) Transcript_104568:982-1680(-)
MAAHRGRVVPPGRLPLPVLVPDGDQLFKANRGVGVHHGAVGRHVLAHGWQHSADLLARKLIPEHRDELQARRAQDRFCADGVRACQLRGHQAREEGVDVHILVRHRDALALRLAPDNERDDQVNARILEALGALWRDLPGLVHQRFDVIDQDFCHLGLVQLAHCLDQIHGTAPPRLLIGALHVPTYVLGRIVLEHLGIGISQDDVRENHLFADARQDRMVLEGRLLPSRRCG